MSPFGAKMSGQRLERAKASPRYREGAFHNTHTAAPGLKKGTALPTVTEFLWGGQRRTPPAPLPSVSPLDAWARPVETGLRATWLGHSTVLVEIDGARVLTDPVWGERASPVSFAGPKRFQPVPVALDALPELDLVIISHDHYDHLDYRTILRLARRGVPFVTSLGVGAHLEAWGVPKERIVELDWWENVELPRAGITVTAAPSQHFSGRSIGSRNLTLWSSLVVRGKKHAFFFSGDTGLTPEYGEIRRRLGPFDLVMLEVGAFHPAWGDIHLGPENALEALTLLGGGSLLPVHWGTFNLAIHAWDEPAETLVKLAPARGAHLVMPELGQPIEPSRAERVEPWWRGASMAESRSRQEERGTQPGTQGLDKVGSLPGAHFGRVGTQAPNIGE
jgi:L-ascorbate metabolism protein UlaG (beta-lactamase superfamily)